MSSEIEVLLDLLVRLGEIQTNYTSFIKKFPVIAEKRDTGHYIHGDIKLCGAISGRPCCTADTLYFTNKGVLPYSKLKLGYKVLTHTGYYKPITAKGFKGEATIYRVTTSNGLTLKTNGKHPYYVNGKFVPAKDLKIGDTLSVLYDPETWKPVKGFSYEVSSLGRVRNSKGKVISACTKPKGHQFVDLYKDSKRTRIALHRLVYKTFVGTLVDGLIVTHINGNPADNRVCNLRQTTYKQNTVDAINHHSATGGVKVIPDNDIDIIRNSNMTTREIADSYGVSLRHALRIIKGERRTDTSATDKPTEFYKATVAKIEVLGKEGIYALVVEDNHTHVTNGIVTHNTGGGDVNLLALPSTGSKLAKPVKQIMTAPKDRLVVTADYSGQEDYCASVVTKDPNMLIGKVLGRDGHSSRSLAYFPELLPEHTKLIKEAENASESVTFWIDDSKSGIDKFIIKEK